MFEPLKSTQVDLFNRQRRSKKKRAEKQNSTQKKQSRGKCFVLLPLSLYNVISLLSIGMQFNVFNDELEELTVNPQSLTVHCWIWHCFYPAELSWADDAIRCVRIVYTYCVLYDARQFITIIIIIIVIICFPENHNNTWQYTKHNIQCVHG